MSYLITLLIVKDKKVLAEKDFDLSLKDDIRLNLKEWFKEETGLTLTNDLDPSYEILMEKKNED